MPFSKHVVDPAHIETMRTAFQKVCEALRLDCKPGDALTDLIVMKIIEFAKSGETDPDRLCSRVVLELGNQPKSNEK